MVSPRDDVMKRAMKLDADDRSIIAHALLDSIREPVDPEIERAWIEEAQRRYEAYKRGEIESVDGEQALREIEAELGA